MAVPAREATRAMTSLAGIMDETKNGLPKAASSHGESLGAEQSPFSRGAYKPGGTTEHNGDLGLAGGPIGALPQGG